MTRLQRLALITSVATFLLIVIGGGVRVTGSGMGCPDWPLCHGGIIPPSERHTDATVQWEFGHRLAASVVGLLVGALVVAIWRAYRRNRLLVRGAGAAVIFLVVQILLGGVTVMTNNAPWTVTAHLATSMALFASLLFITVASFATGPRGARVSLGGVSEGFVVLALATGAAIYGVMLTGAYVRGEGAGLACKGWPLCNGQVFPGSDRLADIHAFHRLAVAAAAVLVGVLVWKGLTRYRDNRPLRLSVFVVAALYGAQVLVGGGQIWLEMTQEIRLAHVAFGSLVWGALVVTATLAWLGSHRTDSGAADDHSQQLPQPQTARETISAYIGLTKPRIIELLLVTTVPAMVLAERGMPHPLLILGTLVGGMLTAGGANAINCYIDRDIDQLMQRTSHRSLPSHRVSPDRALMFGIAIGVGGFLWLAVLVNLLSAVLSVSAILFYVFIYTMWLKRTTVQNIVIGGAAGAVPPLVGWAAVSGRLDLSALVLFAIIFFWTPPHFWALALRYRADYAAAGVPMLPVARGEEETRRQIFIYSVLLVGVTMLLYVTGGAGIVYLVVAALLGAALIRMAYQLLRSREAFPVMKLFTYSITYLAALFAAMVLDQAVRSLA